MRENPFPPQINDEFARKTKRAFFHQWNGGRPTGEGEGDSNFWFVLTEIVAWSEEILLLHPKPMHIGYPAWSDYPIPHRMGCCSTTGHPVWSDCHCTTMDGMLIHNRKSSTKWLSLHHPGWNACPSQATQYQKKCRDQPSFIVNHLPSDSPTRNLVHYRAFFTAFPKLMRGIHNSLILSVFDFKSKIKNSACFLACPYLRPPPRDVVGVMSL